MSGQKVGNVATEQLTIQDWVKGLAAIPARDFTLENVQNYVLQRAVLPETLDKYCYFSKGSYTRNLIFKNDVFECMTVCWEIGQHSRVHNHRDQNCWMSVPIGRLRVQNYRVEHRHTAQGTCEIVPTDIYQMDAAHPAYVNPMEPVHEVINALNSTSAPSAFMCIPSRSTAAKSTSATRAPMRTCRCFTPANTVELNPAEKPL